MMLNDDRMLSVVCLGVSVFETICTTDSSTVKTLELTHVCNSMFRGKCMGSLTARSIQLFCCCLISTTLYHIMHFII